MDINNGVEDVACLLGRTVRCDAREGTTQENTAT